VAGARVIRLRRADTCSRCAAALLAGVEAVWDSDARTVTCAACAARTSKAEPGVAGASVRAEGERRRAAEEERRRQRVERRPMLGRIANAIAGPPTAGAEHLKGAVGEEKFGAALDTLTEHGVLILHDRRRPRTAANIDHLAIAAGGVWVIDAKRYTGRIQRIDKGGWLKVDYRLVVGGRDRTNLVDGVERQIADVRGVLDRALPTEVRVRGALCFVDGDFALFPKPFGVGEVMVTWGKALRKRLMEPGPLDTQDRTVIYECLASKLPPARA
jgi:hypothetical protein